MSLPPSKPKDRRKAAVREALETLEQLSEQKHVDEHALNEMSKKLKTVHEMCDEGSEATGGAGNRTHVYDGPGRWGIDPDELSSASESSDWEGSGSEDEAAFSEEGDSDEESESEGDDEESESEGDA